MEKIKKIFKKIFEHLRSGNPKRRESAIRQLSRTPTKEIAHAPIDLLMSALDDDDEFVRINAAWALASKGEAAGVQRLARALSDPSPSVRRAIVEALADIGAAAEPIVLGLLDDPDPFLRGGAIRVIGKMGLRAVLPRVIEALGDASEDVRRGAAESLVWIGDESAIPALIRSLTNDVNSVRCYAKGALKALGVPAVRALSGALSADNSAVRLAAIDVLRWDAIKCAVLGLKRLGDPGAAPYLLAALDDPDTGVREAVLSALMVCGDVSALPRLLVAWRDPDPRVQRSAARTLGRIGDETILPEILKALDDPDGPRRADAVEILVAITGWRMINRLNRALQDVDPVVRRAAAAALKRRFEPEVPALVDLLERLGEEPEAVPALVDLLTVPNEEDRQVAAKALGVLGDPEAVPALVAALSDRDHQVRRLAAEALGAIGDPGAISGLTAALADQDYWVRYEVIQALGQIGDAAAVSPLLGATATEDSLIRATACIALGQIGDAASLSRLRNLVKDRAVYAEPGVMYSAGGSPRVADAAAGALRAVEGAQRLRTAQFSAYYPKEVRPGAWYGLHAFAFVADAAEQVAADARRLIAEWEAGHREAEAESSHPFQEGTPITMTPALEGFQFNPPSQTLWFYEDWHRFDFKLRADAERAGKASNGSLEIRLGWAIIADMDLSIYVQKPGIDPASPPTARYEGPLEAIAVTRALYRSVFCSHSRRDRRVVRQVEIACRTLGIKYLRDVVSLSSGEPWAPALLEMIERADIFQLFWSKNSCASEYVEQEWRHALGLNREDQRFIRPVYWAEPMPPAPKELQHLNFAFVPDLTQRLGGRYRRPGAR